MNVPVQPRSAGLVNHQQGRRPFQLMGNVLSAHAHMAAGLFLSTDPERLPQRWWEDTASGQPGSKDNEQEAHNDRCVERLTEQGNTEEDGDGRVDVGDNGATTGSDLTHQGEEDQIGQRRADQAEHEQAHYHLKVG